MAITSKLHAQRLPVNPSKKIKMLKRRLQTQQNIISSLELQNHELVTELNDIKISFTNMTTEYNKLMSRNYEQAVTINHNQEEFMKHTNFYDSEIMAALKPLGCLSEILLNLKSKLSQSSVGWKTETIATLPAAPTINAPNIQAFPSESKKNQATVSPMVHGYVIGNPTISLQRLRLEPGEISAATRVERAQLNDINTLSPIQEEQPSTEPIRSRLGSRTVPQQNPGNAPRLSDLIPAAHAEPVVRLSDVSRLLSNTSWLNVRYLPNDGNDAESLPEEITSTRSSPFSPKIENITVRPRKKKKALKKNSMDAAERLSSSPLNLNVENENITVAGRTSIPTASSSRMNISSELPVQGDDVEVNFENRPSCSLAQELSENESNVRPRTKRVRKPSRRILEAESAANALIEDKTQNNSQIASITQRRRSSDLVSTKNKRSIKRGEDVSFPAVRRTSKRNKKEIKYLDEPFNNAEMKRILRKGLKKT